jgi:hypothetical protein
MQGVGHRNALCPRHGQPLRERNRIVKHSIGHHHQRDHKDQQDRQSKEGGQQNRLAAGPAPDTALIERPERDGENTAPTHRMQKQVKRPPPRHHQQAYCQNGRDLLFA